MTGAGFVVWFTGLSGAGKSTLAAMLAAELAHRGVHVETLDGDEVRTHLSKGLGFSREDRDVNVRRIGFVAKLLARSGACAITAAISPYREIRDEQRRAIPRFFEVFCECPVAALADRDPKGLYRKALAGEIRHFTGVDDPYEPPLAPDVHLRTDREGAAESLARIVEALEARGWIPRASQVATTGATGTASATARRLVAPHGGELVDRRVRGEQRDALAERARALPAVVLDATAAADLAAIASGAFSPLRGFAGEKDWRRVVREMRLENGLVWPLPILFAVDDDTRARIGSAAEVALWTGDGRMVAVLEVSDRFTPDPELEARHVYGTTDRAHPGVARLSARPATCLGGEVRVLDEPLAGLGRWDAGPAEMRAAAAALGWTKVVAFRTRGPMHRAHEYVTKCALEGADGLLVQLAAAGAEERALPLEVRARCCEALLDGYYPRERARLVVDRVAPRDGGAREAVLHAVVAQNHGASSLVMGRDDGDADGASRLFDAIAPGELGARPLVLDRAYPSPTTGAFATQRTTPDAEPAAGDLVGARLAAALREGAAPGPELVRPEVARILAEALRDS